MRYRLPALLLAIAALALVATGCGGDDDDEAATDEPVVTEATDEAATDEDAGTRGKATTVSMTEYAFDPSDFTVSQGDAIEVENDGQIVHNLTVQDDGLATEDVEAGQSDEVTVDLAPGDYDFICTIGNHAELGMTGTLTVE